jgi:hypothetical protein
MVMVMVMVMVRVMVMVMVMAGAHAAACTPPGGTHHPGAHTTGENTQQPCTHHHHAHTISVPQVGAMRAAVRAGCGRRPRLGAPRKPGGEGEVAPAAALQERARAPLARAPRLRRTLIIIGAFISDMEI